MPLINTDAILEYFVWVVIIYILPSSVSSAMVTTVINSDRARNIFKGGIQLVNIKFGDWVSVLENVDVASFAKSPRGAKLFKTSE